MSTGFEKKSKIETSFTPSVDSFKITSKFQEYFTQVKDPRVERTRWHLLTDIITISILAVIAGVQGWEDIEEYGQERSELINSKLFLLFLTEFLIFNSKNGQKSRRAAMNDRYMVSVLTAALPNSDSHP